MPSSTYTVNILIKAQDKTGRPTTTATDRMKGLAKAAGLVAAGFAAIKTAKVVAEFVELGASAQMAEDRFIKFAGSADEAAKLLTAFQEATDFTVPKMESMQSAAKLLQMGLVSNSEEMAFMAEVAVKLGDQTKGAEDRIADFSLLLANQAVLRLDNFGISAAGVRERIDELLESGEALNREDAFKMAVMEEGAKQLEIIGDTSTSTQTQIEQLKAAFADLKTEAALAAAELAGGSGAIGDFALRLRGLPETITQITILFKAFTSIPLVKWITDVSTAIPVMLTKWNPLVIALKGARDMLAGVVFFLDKLGLGMGDFLGRNDAFRESIIESTTATKGATDQADALGKSIDAIPTEKTVKISVIETIKRVAGGVISSIFNRQHGGLASGVGMVGEAGPEMVQLPPGSRVSNRNQTINNNNNYNMTVNTRARSPSVQQDFRMMQARVGV